MGWVFAALVIVASLLVLHVRLRRPRPVRELVPVRDHYRHDEGGRPRWPYSFAVLALVTLAGAVCAVPDDPAPRPVPKAGPVIEGDATAEYLLTLKVSGLAAGDLLFWDVLPDGVLSAREIDSDNSIDLAGPPGVYTVKARGTAGGKKFQLSKKVTLTGGKPAPIPPGPKPPDPTPPGPNPPPVPVGRVTRFIVAEDTTKAGAWRGDVLGSPKVAAWYKATAVSHRLVDVNADGADPLVGWVKREAAGKALPWLWQIDDAGKVVKSQPCPTDPDGFVAAFAGAKADGDRGATGCNPAPKTLRWTEFGSTPTTPIIPRAQWKPVSLETFLPPVYDQQSRGQCVASSTCTCIEACRAQAGLPYVHLSAGDLYSRINHGRDQGATLEESLVEATRNGVTTTERVPYVWDGRRHADPGDRKNYLILEAYLCPSFDAAASALQQGFFLEEALTWRAGYKPGPDGWLPVNGGRAVGGHALCGYGLAEKGGKWGIRTRNSWNTGWGQGGDCIIPEQCFDDIAMNGFFAVRAVIQTADGKFPVPSARVDPFRRPGVSPDRFALAY